jgi:hypothetical protein
LRKTAGCLYHGDDLHGNRMVATQRFYPVWRSFFLTRSWTRVKNEYRLVEPYSLRLTRDGNVLFYGIKSENRQIRAYRIDRVQSVEVTRKPYKPIYTIEFTPDGRIPIPLVRRRIRLISRRTDHKYVFQCAVCGKHFYRNKFSTRIGQHKMKDSMIQCYGRYGYLV